MAEVVKNLAANIDGKRENRNAVVDVLLVTEGFFLLLAGRVAGSSIAFFTTLVVFRRR